MVDIPEPPLRPSAEESLKRAVRGPGRLTREALREEPVVREPVRVPPGEQRLQRRRKRSESPYDLSPEIIADAKSRGMSLEWKRESCFNQPDVQHQVGLQDNHWAPVPTSRYPWLMPADKQGGPVRRDGMLLMERPLYLTEEARAEDYNEARLAVHIKEQQMGKTPEGTLSRSHGSAGAKIKHDYEPIVLEKE